MKRKPCGPGAVRISAGRWKGRALEVPAAARPTSSRAREALFDILGPRLAGARVLDLHAGSGAIGLEALSRGARSALLVDVDAAAARRNVRRIGADPGAEVLECDSREAMRILASRGAVFDLVFSDPPYVETSGALSDLGRLLEPGGALVVQSDAGALVESPPGLVRTSERAYGRNVFHFFIRADTP